MIDHIGIDVSDYEMSKKFYTMALAPLGIGIVMEVTAEQSGTTAAVGMGRDGNPFFWFAEGAGPISPVHIAFSAPDRKKVDDFYQAALDAGAKDNGKPGVRPHYHPDYYGAFVIDRDGHNMEAVCHIPE